MVDLHFKHLVCVWQQLSWIISLCLSILRISPNGKSTLVTHVQKGVCKSNCWSPIWGKNNESRFGESWKERVMLPIWHPYDQSSGSTNWECNQTGENRFNSACFRKNGDPDGLEGTSLYFIYIIEEIEVLWIAWIVNSSYFDR